MTKKCITCGRGPVVLLLTDLVANTPKPDVVGFCSVACLRKFLDDRFPQKAASMTETLMNPNEEKFWDSADRQATGPNTPSFEDISEAVEWDKKCK